MFGIRPERESDAAKKKLAGILLVTVVLAVTLTVTGGLLTLAGMLHPAVRIVLECIICYQMLTR